MPVERNKYSLSIFFPCFNEQDNVLRVATQCIDVAEKITDDYEIIIVNDGSADRTKQIAEDFAVDKEKVKVINHSTNLGYGAALQSGFKNSTKQLVFYTDGDGQFDVNQLIDILPAIDDFDIISCYRIKRQDSFFRKLFAFCWCTLVNILFKLRLKDIDCAFKLYWRKIFDDIKMESTGALIDTEILARAKKKGYTIKQFGVKHLPRIAGQQTGANISVILRAFKELFKLYLKIKNDK